MARRKPARLRVIPLGGLDEIGKNMTVFEYGGDMVVVDAGIMFPDDDLPGVDLVLPDYTYILERKHKLRGIVVTHGHEDHTGALPYLLRDLDQRVPIISAKLTLGLIEGKLAEAGIKKPDLRQVADGETIQLGRFGFSFMAVNHSIPDALALLIDTPVGRIVHTGDFKFDQTPIDGRTTDFAAIADAGAGAEGVLLLMSDSTNAETPGYTRSEAEVGKALRKIFENAEQRVIVASFASHVHRVQQICDAAVASGRKVVVTGRSMIQTVGVARELGYLHIDDKNVVDAFKVEDLPTKQQVVLSTGSQGEPLSALARMANNEHRTVGIEAGDTVIMSSTPVPGNEKAVSRVINKLFRSGAEVFHKGVADVHVSGHAASEELKLMLSLVKPRYFMPIHGETRHLVAHAHLAEAVGMKHQDVFVIDNGDCLELSADKAQLTDHVQSGVVYVDGIGVGDVGQVVLRDRQHMANDGIAMIVVTVDAANGAVIGEPELVMRGVVLADGPDDEFMEEARARINKTLARTAKERATDQGVIKNALRESLSQYVWEKMHRRPLVLPIVMEV
jgi:ribonuclease J